MGTICISWNCYGYKTDLLYLFLYERAVYDALTTMGEEEQVMKYCLTQGELIRFVGGKEDSVIRCTSGTLWLTCGDGRDYLLGAGKSFTVTAGQFAVVEALLSSECFLSKAPYSEKTLQRPVISFAAC